MAAPVVVAVDLSGPSRQALAHAAAMAARRRAPLLVVLASQFPRVPAYAMSLGSSDEGRSQIEDGAEAAQRARLDEWVAPLREQGLDVDIIVRRAPPDELVLSVALQHGAQLIVVGRRGHGGARRLLLGSVAHAILRRADVPVLVVPGR